MMQEADTVRLVGAMALMLGVFFFFITLKPGFESMRLQYEPSSEPPHISAK